MRPTVAAPVSRRAALAGAATSAVVVWGAGAAAAAVPTGAQRARYLTSSRLAVLRAVVDRVVPGQPEDTVAGAVAAGCHEAIDALLGAFTVDPPRIYAGGPFSDRGGSRVNHFAKFLPLDRYEERAWKLRILGSRGHRDLERNGPVTGMQQVYRTGLDALAASVPGFTLLPGPLRDLALQGSQNAAVTAMFDLAVAHTLEFMYGAPEYGGNKDGVGWHAVGFEGDRQPRGYTRAEVTAPKTELLPLVDAPLEDLLDALGLPALPPLPPVLTGAAPTAAVLSPLLPLASSEVMAGLHARAAGSHRELAEQVRDLVAPVLSSSGARGETMARLHAEADRLVCEARSRTGRQSAAPPSDPAESEGAR
ncbi:gluconate 2-dehydrogenase subunit 3 family protein [Nocardioides sp. R-C-SC26]|uniref:gluconate 2-dehydrogenase subunit 3 family protein n=1 Tax=Nocardioides sp. R-C-SC26 TaxID=2870414 RepID=UPI001E49E04A|nr:gluconate 2-dehydrogenase subunit 3 family protein [Nocardioides sp. R-C-SC26]